jgi:hypothetical protein
MCASNPIYVTSNNLAWFCRRGGGKYAGAKEARKQCVGRRQLAPPPRRRPSRPSTYLVALSTSHGTTFDDSRVNTDLTSKTQEAAVTVHCRRSRARVCSAMRGPSLSFRCQPVRTSCLKHFGFHARLADHRGSSGDRAGLQRAPLQRGELQSRRMCKNAARPRLATQHPVHRR